MSSEKKARRRRRQVMMEALKDQLESPAIPEVKMHFHRLLLLGLAEGEVREMMARRLAIYIWHTLQKDNYTYLNYVADLAALPAIDFIDEDTELDELTEPEADDEDLPVTTMPPEPKGTADLMTSILFEIESCIMAADQEARSGDTALNDSLVRSILNKVRKTAEGGRPKVPNTSVREAILAEMYTEICEVRQELGAELSQGEAAELPLREWVLALRTVEDSIRLHSTGSGSRAYLDYVAEFLPRVDQE